MAEGRDEVITTSHLSYRGDSAVRSRHDFFLPNIWKLQK